MLFVVSPGILRRSLRMMFFTVLAWTEDLLAASISFWNAMSGSFPLTGSKAEENSFTCCCCFLSRYSSNEMNCIFSGAGVYFLLVIVIVI